jgi:hypothetical protein
MLVILIFLAHLREKGETPQINSALVMLKTLSKRQDA